MDTNLFYGKVSHHRYLRHAVDEIEESSTTRADRVITAHLDGGVEVMAAIQSALMKMIWIQKRYLMKLPVMWMFFWRMRELLTRKILSLSLKRRNLLFQIENTPIHQTLRPFHPFRKKDIFKILQIKHQDLINFDEYGLYAVIL